MRILSNQREYASHGQKTLGLSDERMRLRLVPTTFVRFRLRRSETAVEKLLHPVATQSGWSVEKEVAAPSRSAQHNQKRVEQKSSLASLTTNRNINRLICSGGNGFIHSRVWKFSRQYGQ